MTIRFSPLLFSIVLGAVLLEFGQAVLATHDTQIPALVLWPMILCGIAFCVWQISRARRTGVVEVPIFIWFWRIDSDHSQFLYWWGVSCYGAGVLSGVALLALSR
jgi:hypothetical protein